MLAADPHTTSVAWRTRPLRRFSCSFCGKSRPECDLIGRDGALLFCGRCVTALDALHNGSDDALAIWKESP